MAQHQQLKVPDLDAPATAKQQLQQRNERQVDERQDHRTILSAPATPQLPGRSGFWHPSGPAEPRSGRAQEARDPAPSRALACRRRRIRLSPSTRGSRASQTSPDTQPSSFPRGEVDVRRRRCVLAAVVLLDRGHGVALLRRRVPADGVLVENADDVRHGVPSSVAPHSARDASAPLPIAHAERPGRRDAGSSIACGRSHRHSPEGCQNSDRA